MSNKKYTLILFGVFLSILLLTVLSYKINQPKNVQSTLAKTVSMSSWAAFGEMRGHIEPCGCNPETDLGGAKRIANAILQLKTRTPDMAVFVLGQMFSTKSEKNKDKFIVSLYELIQPTAILPGIEDLAQIRSKNQSSKYAPYVLSNAGDDISGINKKLQYPNFIVYGYLSSAFYKDLRDLNSFLDDVSSDGVTSQKVLLFSGNELELNQIINQKIFDVVISSNDRLQDESPDQLEVSRPGLLHWFAGIYKVPVFAQGLLLGGELRQLMASTSIFGDKSKSRDLLSQKQEKLFLWLDRSYESVEILANEYLAYQKSQNQAFDQMVHDRLTQLESTKFAGAQACKTCHSQAFDVWQQSHHAIAYKTLVEKSKDKDIDCVTCHVLGMKEPGGFVNIEHTPNFAGVQCENCHGAALEHTKNPTEIKPTQSKPEKVCISCHHSPHTTDFDFSNYWQKIRHN